MRQAASAARSARAVPGLLAACMALLLSGVALLLSGVALAQDGSLELAVKAAYLYKFALFVEWPSSAFSDPASPFVLCIAGDGRLGGLVDEVVAGQRVNGRPIALRRLPMVARDSGCDTLYAAGSPAQSVADALAAVGGGPVLTVTDAERNGGPKGIINFVVTDNHVRFEIDDAAAARNGLAISSKLLSLAVHVIPRI